ncbi:MAG: hypothetical protein UGF89_06570 [Acutalibacteraceae bacterium]|nr:hypothetical protein [Acutalibacteraceae bacterium]
MNCPVCNIKISCVDSTSTGENTFRKYKCYSCGKVVYTHEQVNEGAKIPLNLLREEQKKKNKEYKQGIDKRKSELLCKQTSEDLPQSVSFSSFSDIKEALEEAIRCEKGKSGAKIIVVSVGGGD